MTDASDRWRRVEELCHAALEHDARERSAFLTAACGDDVALRREVEALLAHEPDAAAFLSGPVAAVAADVMSGISGASLVGRRIGAYEILSQLGVGGMGEVYRARDTELGREVAIKVLPAIFTSDPERLTRFEREARVLASLNHPHIGAIYGLEHLAASTSSGQAGLIALVLELVDGDTLGERIGVRKSGLPMGDALAIAQQIAEALAAAHEKGIVHRDLKPANVVLTKSGAKLLDFGLAKWARGPDGSVNAAAMKSNVLDSVTEKGTILGTTHYMAPEQLEGKEVDARADVFAFGAVLYEMLTGRKAFDAGSAAAVMAAVLNAEPAPLATIQPLVPRSLERLTRKCLAKDPDHRWHSARDLADELRWIAEDVVRPDRTQENRRPLRFGSVAALVAIVTALAGWAGWSLSSSRESSPFRAVSRFAVVPSTLVPIGGFDISPDGTLLVYSGGPPGSKRLFMRRLDQFSDLPIAGTERADAPFFSPDGQWVAFFAGEKLLKVNVQTTTAPILICDDIGDLVLQNGAAWLKDGNIIFARQEKGLQRVSAQGGKPAPLTSLNQASREFDHHSPSLLPGGQVVLFTAHESNGRFNVVVQALASGERKVVIESAYDAIYAATGHLVFARNHTVLAAPFDLRRLEITGPAVILVEAVAGGPLRARAAISTTGSMARRDGVIPVAVKRVGRNP
jgi:eukaryotic-like serine/threonine-protein kinase